MSVNNFFIVGRRFGGFLLQIFPAIMMLASASAQVTWTGPASGDWMVGANWSGGSVPGTTDDVLIDGGGVQDSTVMLGTSDTINNLGISAGDTLAVTAGSFTVNGPVINNEGMLLLSGTANLLAQNGATILSGGGTVRLSDTARLRSSAGGSLTNQGNTIEGAGELGFNGLGIVNGAAGVIDANVSGQTLTVNPSAAGDLSNAGIMQASNGGILVLTGSGAGEFDNTGGTVRALTGSELQLISNASIEGGTLATQGTGVIKVVSGQVANLKDLTIAGNVVGENNTDIKVEGAIVNNGTIRMNAGPSFADLVLNADTQLTGGGRVILADDAARARINGSGGVLTNSDNTIEGQGLFGGNTIGIINEAAGLIDANVSGATLTVDPNAGGGLRNLGTMQASNGGILVLTGSGGGVFDNTGGTIQALDGSEVQLAGNAIIAGGEFTTVGSGVVRVAAGNVARWSDLTNSGAVIVANNATLDIGSDIVNSGSVTLTSSGSFSSLNLSADTQLSGGGGILLTDASRARILGSGTLTNMDNRISGAGFLGNNSINVINQASGLVDADIAGEILQVNPAAAAGFTNLGMMQASGGGILQLTGNGGGAFFNTGGTIRALDGSEVQLITGAIVEGGTLATLGSGVFKVTEANIGTLRNLVLNGNVLAENNTDLEVLGAIANSGTITINAGASLTDLTLEGDTTFTGAGRIVLESGTADARIVGSGTLTNFDNTIEGDGGIGVNTIGIVNESGGVIEANVNGSTLTLNPSAAGGLVNRGTMRATNGGILSLSGGGGGAIDSSTGTVEALDGSIVELVGSIALSNGVLNTEGSGVIRVTAGGIGNLADVTNTGNLIGEDNSDFQLSGMIDNQGTITMEAGASFTDLQLLSDTQLSGGGTIVFANNANARLLGGATLTNVDNTLQGQGAIGANTTSIVNQAAGVIEANVSGQILKLDPAAAGGYSGDGTLRARDGGILELVGSGGGTFAIGLNGTVEALNGGSVTNSSAIVTNNSGGTLTGGTWRAVSAGGGATSLDIGGSAITTNDADIFLSGADASITQLSALETNLGTLALEGDHTFTTVGGFTNEGTLSLGPGGTLDVNGDFETSDTGTLEATVDGLPSATSDWGRILATGKALISGALEVAFNVGDAFTATVGDAWQIIASDSVQGFFDTISMLTGTVPADAFAIVQKNSAGVELRVISAPDYITWVQSFGLDPNGNGQPFIDHDKDGTSNLIEYGLDMNPTLSDPERLPVRGFIQIGLDTFQTLTYERPGGAGALTNIVYLGQRSNTLADFDTAGVVEHSVSPVDAGTGRETVILRSTVARSVSGNGNEYMRLGIQLKP